jgi:Ser/Thr protein kinase RdoA (MazF antagonist)
VIDGLPDWLPDWCFEQLGAAPVAVLLRTAQMASVFGLRLTDGHEVAVKSRPDESGRTASCVAAQLHLADHGYPCARPLTPVTSVGALAVNAEEWRPGGQMRRGNTAAEARLCAAAFAHLTFELESVRVAPPLPNPYWLDWDHGGDGLWPTKHFLEERDQSLVPDFVVDCVTRATARLRASDLPCVLGHADFEAQNLRWCGSDLWSVFDWDSLAWMPEAALVGAASGSFASTEIPTLAPLDSSTAFIATYQSAHGRPFSPDELEVAWAASIWPAGHNARGEALFGSAPSAGQPLREQAAERLRRAGA